MHVASFQYTIMGLLFVRWCQLIVSFTQLCMTVLLVMVVLKGGEK